MNSPKETHLPRSIHARTPKAVIAVATCIVIAALYLAREVLIPLALAMLLTFLLAPLVHYLERRKVPRVPAVLIVVAGVFLLIGLLGWIVVGQMLDLANNVDQYKGNIVAKIERLQPHGGLWTKLKQFGQDVGSNLRPPPATRSTANPSDEAAPVTQPSRDNPLPVTILQQPSSSPLSVPLRTIGQFSQYGGLVLGPLGTAGIVIVFVIFMLLSYGNLRDRIIRLAGYDQMLLTTRALDDAAGRITRYLSAQAIVNGTYGLAIAFGLWLIGRTIGHHNPPFPNVVLWGLLCAMLRFIPYIGPWIGASFPLLVAFAVYPGFAVFLAAIGLFVVIELFSNNFMEPWLYGASTGMSTIAILVAAVFWTWLWGPVGLLLATPLTVCLVVLGKHVPALNFLDVLLGDEPVLEPHERVYQRLLARDEEEAAEVAEEYLEKMPLEKVYDQVLLPALAMSEQDRHRGRLDDERKDFIRDAMRDVIDEVMDQHHAKRIRTAAAFTEAQARGVEPPREPAAPALPAGARVSVTILPAYDPADEIAGTMLANVLQTLGYHVTLIPVRTLASEMLETVEREQTDVAVVSALPPAAVTHSRYLCKRLHGRFPDIETIVGLWTWKGDPQKAKDRIACTRTVHFGTSLHQVLEIIHQVIQPVLVRQTESKRS